MTDHSKKGDRKQWQTERVGGNRKQQNSDEDSRSNTETANQIAAPVAKTRRASSSIR